MLSSRPPIVGASAAEPETMTLLIPRPRPRRADGYMALISAEKTLRAAAAPSACIARIRSRRGSDCTNRHRTAPAVNTICPPW